RGRRGPVAVRAARVLLSERPAATGGQRARLGARRLHVSPRGSGVDQGRGACACPIAAVRDTPERGEPARSFPEEWEVRNESRCLRSTKSSRRKPSASSGGAPTS